MDLKNKKKINDNSRDFLFGLYDLNIIGTNMDEHRWIGTFGPPYYVLFLNYLNHYYCEISRDDIDEMCRYFVDEFFNGREMLIEKMIKTNKDIANMIDLYRSKGLDYSESWGLCFYCLFNMNVDVDGSICISELAYKMTEDRRIIKSQLVTKKEVFVTIAKGVADICRDIFRKHNIVISTEYFDGFGLYCTKWFTRFEYSTKTLMDDTESWLSRSFVTQYFILLVIDEFVKTTTEYSKTKCFTMWNHMNRFNDTVLDQNSSLTKAILLFIETNTEDNSNSEKLSLANEANKKISRFLYGKTICF